MLSFWDEQSVHVIKVVSSSQNFGCFHWLRQMKITHDRCAHSAKYRRHMFLKSTFYFYTFMCNNVYMFRTQTYHYFMNTNCVKFLHSVPLTCIFIGQLTISAIRHSFSNDGFQHPLPVHLQKHIDSSTNDDITARVELFQGCGLSYTHIHAESGQMSYRVKIRLIWRRSSLLRIKWNQSLSTHHLQSIPGKCFIPGTQLQSAIFTIGFVLFVPHYRLALNSVHSTSMRRRENRARNMDVVRECQRYEQKLVGRENYLSLSLQIQICEDMLVYVLLKDFHTVKSLILKAT